MGKFRNLIENVDEQREDLCNLNKKGAQIAWEYYEDVLADSGISFGDAMPEDCIEKLSDKQVKEIHNKVKRFIK